MYETSRARRGNVRPTAAAAAAVNRACCDVTVTSRHVRCGTNNARCPRDGGRAARTCSMRCYSERTGRPGLPPSLIHQVKSSRSSASSETHSATAGEVATSWCCPSLDGSESHTNSRRWNIIFPGVELTTRGGGWIKPGVKWSGFCWTCPWTFLLVNKIMLISPDIYFKTVFEWLSLA